MPRKTRPLPAPGKGKPDRLVFTDLDGTLLERESYSWKPAEPALKGAEKAGIPVIFCTSKTRAEIEHYRKETGNRHPFIPENGGAIYVPRGYFGVEPPGAVRSGKYSVIGLGKPYGELRAAIKRMRREGLKVRGFGDMTVQELVKLSGLSRSEAVLARKREYDEPFLLEDPRQEKRVLAMAGKLGLQCVMGTRFRHLTGDNDKGLAVKILTSLYDEHAGMPVVTMGLGDSPNDFPMLRAVHVPFLVRGHDGRYAQGARGFSRAGGTGPHGWNAVVLEFIGEEF